MLKKIGKIACFLLLVLTPISLQAQGIIKGRVVAKIDTEPLIGVTVILLELKKAVSTDVDGRFSLRVSTVSEKSAELTVRLISYEDYAVKVVDLKNTSLQIELKQR
jgi:hypothetical protein